VSSSHTDFTTQILYGRSLGGAVAIDSLANIFQGESILATLRSDYASRCFQVIYVWFACKHCYIWLEVVCAAIFSEYRPSAGYWCAVKSFLIVSILRDEGDFWYGLINSICRPIYFTYKGDRNSSYIT